MGISGVVLALRCRAYFCGVWPRDSSIEVLEWLFTWPAFGMALLSSLPFIEPVGLLAAVSALFDVPLEEVALLVDDGVVAVSLDGVDEVPVGPLVDVSLGVPAPVGLLGAAGSGGAADSLVDVDGVTGGVAVVVVEEV